MAVASVLGTGTRGGTEVNIAWRKAQSKLLKGFNTKTEEWTWLQSLTDFEVDYSAREITCPIDVYRATHAAAIPEGGYEARPYTPNLSETTVVWSNYNQRFSTTLTSRYLDQTGKNNQIIKQFKYQMMKAIEGLSDTVGRDFYGYSTGAWAKTSTAATSTSTAYTLIDAYGLTETHADQASFLGSMFVVGDWVALHNGGTLKANAIGQITSMVPATPTITVSWAGNVTSASGDTFVLASSIENTTIAGGTNYNKTLVGLLDMYTSSSLHSLANTVGEWQVGLADTAGGRFSGVKLRKHKQAIANLGGGKLTDIIWSNGVSNDTFASQSGAVRFANPDAMQLDGEATDPGTKFYTSRKGPPGYVFSRDRSAIQKFNLLDFAGEGSQAWDDGDKMEGQNAYAFSIDMPLAMVCTSRRKLAYSNQLTEQ